MFPPIYNPPSASPSPSRGAAVYSTGFFPVCSCLSGFMACLLAFRYALGVHGTQCTDFSEGFFHTICTLHVTAVCASSSLPPRRDGSGNPFLDEHLLRERRGEKIGLCTCWAHRSHANKPSYDAEKRLRYTLFPFFHNLGPAYLL